MTANEDIRRRPGRRALRLPVTMRLCECGVRLLLAAVLAGAELFGGCALFGVAMVGAAGAGVDGLAALLGAVLGYLALLGFLDGLRYVAVCLMVFAVGLALYDYKIYRAPWFMPVAAAAINGMVGFVYLSAGGWTAGKAAAFAAEVVLTGGVAYFYRLAFSVWEERREEPRLTAPQLAGVLVLGGTLLMTLSRVTVAGLSVGRVLAAVAVMIAGWKGGVGAGAVAGIAVGLGMDLSGTGQPWFTLAFSFAGLTAGVLSRQGRLWSMLGYAAACGAAVLWTWPGNGGLIPLYEAAVACTAFFILPDKLLRRLAALMRQEGAREETARLQSYTAGRLRQTAGAFRAVYDSLEHLYAAPPPDDGLPDGPTEADCAASRDLEQRLARRRYDSRVRESRAAVCAQYNQLAGALERAAAEMSAELSVDVKRQRQVKQRMAALGLEGRCAVFQDEHRHLCVELEGQGVERLAEPEELDKLTQVLDCPLRVEVQGRGALHLCQQEPLMAVAGVSALSRDGMPVSGDAGAWFKDDAGRLYMLLCDGMGSGLAARRDSDSALRLMEKFLRAGMSPRNTLRIMGEALALRGEEEGGFTTVDLLQVDLFTGRGAVLKLGAAPTWVRRGEEITVLSGLSLPAGLMTQPEAEPDVFPLELRAGDVVVMLSDGVSAGEDDGWLRTALAEFDGLSPRTLAQRLLAESRDHAAGTDDRTVVVLKLDVRK